MAKIAHEYSDITDMLLINPTEKLGGNAIREGLQKTKANVTVVYGAKDPSVDFAKTLQGDGRTVVILDGVDHHFRGYLQDFINLPMKYLA